MRSKAFNWSWCLVKLIDSMFIPCRRGYQVALTKASLTQCRDGYAESSDNASLRPFIGYGFLARVLGERCSACRAFDPDL